MPQPARAPGPYRDAPISFVRRGRHLPPAQQRAWEEQAQHYLVPVERGAASTSLATGSRLDPDAIFPTPGPLVVEVGSGQGDAVIAAATREPGTRFLAVEVFEQGLARTARNATETGLDNVRLIEANAPEVLAALPDASVHELWVFFPDPWRKAKHKKRRLVDASFAALAVRVLEPGGVLRLATDWEPYAEQMRDVVAAEPGLVNPFEDSDGWAPRFDGRILTAFERKGAAVGRVIHDLTARRRETVA